MSSKYLWFFLALGKVAAQSGSLTATSRASDPWKPAQKPLPQKPKKQECGLLGNRLLIANGPDGTF